MKLLAILAALPLVTCAQSSGPPNMNYIGSTPSQRLSVNQTQAMVIIQAAAREAQSIGSPSNIAVTDPSGLLVGFLRTDNAFPGSIDISQRKARTVSLFNGAFTTASLYNLTVPSGGLYGIEETNGGLVVFGGGMPIYLNSHFIGAVGVSGGTVDQDIQVATAGVSAVGSTNMTSSR
jgi:uncharacterized protein GlcG (DUF336 family)